MLMANVRLPTLCVILAAVLWTGSAVEGGHFSGKNVAEGKNATQYPGTYKNGHGISFPASLAVDGIKSHDHLIDGCTHTISQGSETAVWSVDLDRPYFITGIRIYNRQNQYRARLKGFEVFAYLNEMETMIYQDNGDYENLTINIAVNRSEVFDRVEIHKPVQDGQGILTLCEVEVFAGCDPNIAWTLEHGQYGGTNQLPTPGTVVYPKCAEGYSLQGIGNLTCQQDHTWNFLNKCPAGKACEAEWNKCEQITCKHPGKPNNGRYVYVTSQQEVRENDSFPYRENISLVCNDGNKPENQSLTGRTCIEMNRWTGSGTECIRVTCPWPLKLDNGKYMLLGKDRNVYINTEITAKCNKGFTLVGENGGKTCGSDGKWSNEKITCVPLCRIKPIFYGFFSDVDGHMLRINDKLMENETAYAVCILGYEFNESVSRKEVTCTAEHEMEPSDLKCKVKRCSLPHITNGSYDTTEDSVPYGTPVKVTCDPGYQIKGPSDRHCMPNKNLSLSDPICKRMIDLPHPSGNVPSSPATRFEALAIAVVSLICCEKALVSLL